MTLFKHHNEFAALRKSSTGKGLGLVPTMGVLHQGHLSLIERASNENEEVLVSIFINPTQFDDPSDLLRYPIELEADLAKINALNPNCLVYAPQAEDLYGSSVAAKTYDFGLLNQVMEGAHRKGHFQGVATVVEKLFRIFQPQRAYFGEKDFQQLQVIKQLVQQAQLDVEIVSCPIVRTAAGLALSSRNQLLTPSAQNAALELYAALKAAKTLWQQTPSAASLEHIKKRFDQHPEISLEYFEIREETTLETFDPKHHQYPRAFIAAQLGKIRLIDNLALEKAIPLQHANRSC